MSTYDAEKASNLMQSLESVFAQTRPPEQVVLVVDGPIPPAQESVIRDYCNDRRICDVTVLYLPEKGGLAAAMNAGLKVCVGDYIMRMDSDDICTLDRLEIQLRYALANPDVDIVSSWSEEFFEDGRASQIKVSPVAHEHITAAVRWRNVLVHPTILAKSSALRAVNGYRSKFGMLEDYDLFVRLAMKGYRFCGACASAVAGIVLALGPGRRRIQVHLRTCARDRVLWIGASFRVGGRKLRVGAADPWLAHGAVAQRNPYFRRVEGQVQWQARRPARARRAAPDRAAIRGLCKG